RAGLSGDLAEGVRSGALDAALLTTPAAGAAPAGLTLRPVVREPLRLIASDSLGESEAEALLATQPFIWFSRKTWAGRQIEQILADRGFSPPESMEVDALEAVEALVRHGLGVSVVPWAAGAGPDRPGLRRLALPGLQAERVLGLSERAGSPDNPLLTLLESALRDHTGPPAR
ncbi:MAG: LysR substrate-binding domain-containing protein, partial [Pseudomonadota bacterium]